MEEKAYSTIEQLFKRYQLNNLNFPCKCKTPMSLLCTDDCSEPSLHCQNKECNYSNQKHKFCRKIQFQGLTDSLKQRFDLNKSFLQSFQKVEQDFIARIRKQREKTFSKIIFRDFQDEQIVTLQNLFVRKNIGSVKGIHIEEVYKKLLSQKDSKKKYDEQVEEYQNQLKKIQGMLNQIRMKLEKPPQKLVQLKQSKIIDSKDIEQNKFISKCLNNPKGLKLLFRASQHQFSAAKFHELCDGIPNLLVLVKTELGKVVGGFNPMGWKDSSGYSADNQKKCFIFSVTLRQKMDLIQPENAIYNNCQYGPCFGDIVLCDKCNTNKSSILGFPYFYNFTAKPYTLREQTYKLFSGSPTHNVGIAEYEVFSVQ